MIQPQTQTEAYWVSDFALTDQDIEQVYNFFLEVERPQTIDQITRSIMAARVAAEQNEVKRLLSGRTVYQPRKSYDLGDQLVFPVFQFAQGEVVGSRQGVNPQHGKFTVIEVKIKNKVREFAAELEVPHPLNVDDGILLEPTTEVDLEELFQLFGRTVGEKVSQRLAENPEFVNLGDLWFVKGLMVEINIGHMHLAEAVLEMNQGGPMGPVAILEQLDMEAGIPVEVKSFSLNFGLREDKRFDEVGARDEINWFLRRLEPAEVQEAPERLRYRPIPYDKALLNPQLLLLERELDDEWSDVETTLAPQPIVLTLTYPHRSSGTLPLSSRLRTLFSLGRAPRQRVVFVDEQAGEELVGWVVQEGRYIYGLADWYAQNELPIGGFISLKSGPRPGTLSIDFDRRRPQREWVRLATAEDGRIKFELSRRSIGCGYDDLLIVGTDYVTAMDGLFRRAESRQREVASLLAELMPELASLSPQGTVHAKTLYSAINILRRVPPGPLFAELVRHPAFQAVGDHYWQFVPSRWQRD